jgi:hypothetical protein
LEVVANDLFEGDDLAPDAADRPLGTFPLVEQAAQDDGGCLAQESHSAVFAEISQHAVGDESEDEVNALDLEDDLLELLARG